MSITAVRTAYPAPFVVALRAHHMIASTYLLYSYMTFRTIRKVAVNKPISHFFLKYFLTSFILMLSPFYLTFATERMTTVFANTLLSLILVALCDLVTFLIRTICSLTVHHYI